ncbi:MAG: hypothetical protein ABMB14_23495 [Myxococcota bacterium]
MRRVRPIADGGLHSLSGEQVPALVFVEALVGVRRSWTGRGITGGAPLAGVTNGAPGDGKSTGARATLVRPGSSGLPPPRTAMGFVSIFWSGEPEGDSNIAAALDLASAVGQTPGAQLAAFERLLLGSSSRSRGMAFDHYFYANAQTRFGFGAMVSERARLELGSPAVSGTTASGAPIRGANHASALNIVALLGDARDLPRIGATLAEAVDPSVVWSCCMAASTCLRDCDVAHPGLFAALEAVVGSADLPDATKIEAVDALGASASRESERILERVVRSDRVPASLQAAIRLAERDFAAHRTLLEAFAARLPDDAPYPASDLRDLLEELRTAER